MRIFSPLDIVAMLVGYLVLAGSGLAIFLLVIGEALSALREWGVTIKGKEGP